MGPAEMSRCSMWSVPSNTGAEDIVLHEQSLTGPVRPGHPTIVARCIRACLLYGNEGKTI